MFPPHFLFSNRVVSNIGSHGVTAADQNASSPGYLLRPTVDRKKSGKFSVHITIRLASFAPLRMTISPHICPPTPPPDGIFSIGGGCIIAKSPTWDVIDTCKNAVVHGAYDRDSSRLHFFSDPIQQGWPWVAVPIRPGPRSRAIRGVFCVDRYQLHDHANIVMPYLGFRTRDIRGSIALV